MLTIGVIRGFSELHENQENFIMEIQQILSYLSTLNPMCMNECKDCISFSQINMLPDKAESFPEDTLFVGCVSRVKARMLYTSFRIFFLIKDTEVNNPQFIRNNTVYLFDTSTTEADLLITCRKAMHQYNSYLNCSNDLIELILSDANLEKIATAISSMLKNPVIVVNLNFKVLSSPSYSIDSSFWLRTIYQGYCSFEFISEFSKTKAYQSTTMCFEPSVLKMSNGTNICVSKTYYDGEHRGYMIMVEQDTPLSWIDPDLIALACKAISHVVRLEGEREKTIHGYYGEHIVIECLNGEFKNRQGFMERVRNTDFEVPSCYRAIVVDVSLYKKFDPQKEMLKEQFQRMFNECWTVWCMGQVVCLVNIQNLQEPFYDIIDNNEEFFNSRELRLGISDHFSDLFCLHDYYEQGIQSLFLANVLNHKCTVCFYDNYKFYDLVCQAHQKKLRLYYSDTFIEIVNYDRKHNSSYLDTIYAYLMCLRNLNATAEKLFVHKNTVSYRISKIKEILAINFEDAASNANFLLSYWIKQILDAQITEEIPE